MITTTTGGKQKIWTYKRSGECLSWIISQMNSYQLPLRTNTLLIVSVQPKQWYPVTSPLQHNQDGMGFTFKLLVVQEFKAARHHILGLRSLNSIYSHSLSTKSQNSTERVEWVLSCCTCWTALCIACLCYEKWSCFVCTGLRFRLGIL